MSNEEAIKKLEQKLVSIEKLDGSNNRLKDDILMKIDILKKNKTVSK